MPLAKTFFSSRFGMVADKFGVGWMIMVERRKRCVQHVTGEAMMTTETKSADFVISRVFDAPRELVWESLHRSRAHEAMVGSEGLHRCRVENGSARRRHLSRRHA